MLGVELYLNDMIIKTKLDLIQRSQLSIIINKFPQKVKIMFICILYNVGPYLQTSNGLIYLKMLYANWFVNNCFFILKNKHCLRLYQMTCFKTRQNVLYHLFPTYIIMHNCYWKRTFFDSYCNSLKKSTFYSLPSLNSYI